MSFKPEISRSTTLRQALLLGAILTSPLWFATSQVLAVRLDLTTISTTTTTGATNNTLTDISSAPNANGVSNSPNDINFQGRTTSINSFTVSNGVQTGTGTVSSSNAATLTIRRSGTEQRQNVWYQGTGSSTNSRGGPGGTLTLQPGGPVSQQTALATNNILIGANSALTNDPNSNVRSNAERLDFVLQTTINASSSLGFIVLERGTANITHDAFKIAAITGFDSQGRPTYSGNLYEVNNWGTTKLLSSDVTQIALNNVQSNGTVYTNRPPENPVFFRQNQNLGGVFISTAGTELGLAAGTQVFGYSIFATDVNRASGCGDLVDWTQAACYPTNTLTSLDPAAVNVGAVTVNVVPEPLTVLGSGIALGFGLLMRIQYSKRQNTEQAS